MNWYGKPYTSVGGYTCRYWYHFSINLLFKKKYYPDGYFGYKPFYYDGYYHSFALYPIRIDWHKLPQIVK